MMFNGVRVKDRRKQHMIYAQFFAQFQMAEENVPLSQDQIRSDMVTKLLSYRIYHRGKTPVSRSWQRYCGRMTGAITLRVR